MTYADALKGLTNAPIELNTYKAICDRRGLIYTDTIDTPEQYEDKRFQLCMADVYSYVASLVDLNDEKKVSMPFVTSIYVNVGKANAIYKKYGEPLIYLDKPTDPHKNTVTIL